MTKANSVNQNHGLKLRPPRYLLESTPKKSEMWKPELRTALGGNWMDLGSKNKRPSELSTALGAYWAQLDPYPNPLRTALRKMQENPKNNNIPKTPIGSGPSILLDNSENGEINTSPPKSPFAGKTIKLIPLDEIDESKLIEVPESGK